MIVVSLVYYKVVVGVSILALSILVEAYDLLVAVLSKVAASMGVTLNPLFTPEEVWGLVMAPFITFMFFLTLLQELQEDEMA